MKKKIDTKIPEIYKLAFARMKQVGKLRKFKGIKLYDWDFTDFLDALVEVRDKLVENRKDCSECGGHRCYDLLVEKCVKCGVKNHE